MMYELLLGIMPFGENSDDPFQIYQEIVSKEIDIPVEFCN
jgi:hypothetical protein